VLAVNREFDPIFNKVDDGYSPPSSGFPPGGNRAGASVAGGTLCDERLLKATQNTSSAALGYFRNILISIPFVCCMVSLCDGLAASVKL